LNPPKKKDLIISSRETVEIIQSLSKRWLAGYWNIDTTMKKKKKRRIGTHVRNDPRPGKEKKGETV
jgi:hypothetical protein